MDQEYALHALSRHYLLWADQQPAYYVDELAALGNIIGRSVRLSRYRLLASKYWWQIYPYSTAITGTRKMLFYFAGEAWSLEQPL